LDTDILGANRAGIESALVLTGIDRGKQVLAADATARPTYILEDLRGLSKPYPVAEESVDKNGVHTVMIGDAVVSRSGHVIRVVSPGAPIDRLRAGAKIVYDSGLKIFGLDVDPQIYSEL
jgi:glycerol 3-phosphatase-2